MRIEDRHSTQLIFVVIIFVTSYFFFDFIGLDKNIAIILIGILIGSCYYIRNRQISFTVKFTVLILFSFLAFLIPFFILRENNAQKIKGTWQTDSTEGFSIKIRIFNDSAFLSQSNTKDAVPYEMKIENHQFSISNKQKGKEFNWYYYLSESGNSLILINAKDSLKFYKIN